MRAELIAEGAFEASESGIVACRDILFSSPSAAAAVLMGGQRNGREVWKDTDGAILGDLEDRLLEESGTGGS